MAEKENVYATIGATNFEAQSESPFTCKEDFSKSDESDNYEQMTYSTAHKRGEPVDTIFTFENNIYNTAAESGGETRLPHERENVNVHPSGAGVAGNESGRHGCCANKMWIVTCFTFILALVAVCAATVPLIKMSELKREMETELSLVKSYMQQLNQSIESLDDSVRAKLQQLNHSIENLDKQFTHHENTHSELLQQLTADTLKAINESASVTIHELALLENGVSDEIFMLRNKTLLLNETLYDVYGQLERNEKLISLLLFNSCSALPPSSPSGYYWMQPSNGSVVRVYCDMTLSCGNITGGWMRVAELNMTDNSQQCPSGGLVERVYNDVRQCRIGAGVDCSSTNYTTARTAYSNICGRITAYQVGSTNAFHRRSPSHSASINTNYVDGVSLTRGTPREHIWTFASALDKSGNFTPSLPSYCPCQNVSSGDPNDIVPPFVGQDYFCDSGSEEYNRDTFLRFYFGDPIWDGAGCGPLSADCCMFNTPPWFYKQLPQPTTDDIEMRVCRDEDKENVAIQSFEIYVQ